MRKELQINYKIILQKHFLKGSITKKEYKKELKFVRLYDKKQQNHLL